MKVSIVNLGSSRAVIRTFSAVFGALVISLGAASASNAHTDLVSSNPAAGSSISSTQVPSEISLTFSEPPLLEGSAIVVTNEDGTTTTPATPTLNGATLSIAWPTDLKAGKATVTWRVAADDGHVLSDKFSFTFEQVIDTVGDVSPSAVPTIISPAPASDDSSSSSNTLLWAISTAIVTAGVAVWIRKRKAQ